MKRLVACVLTCIVSLGTFAGLSIAPSNANDVCAGYGPGLETETPDWTVLNGPKIIFRVTWAIPDKNSCITGLDSERGPALIKGSGTPNTFPQTSWQLLRSNDFSILIASFEVPVSWVESSLSAQATYFKAIEFISISFRYKGDRLGSYSYGLRSLRGIFYWDDLWGIYFSKKQGIYSENCEVIESEKPYGATVKYLPDFTYRVESPGKSPTLNVDIADSRQCIHLVGVLPVTKDSVRDILTDFPTLFKIDRYFAHYAFWDSRAKEYLSLFQTNQIPKLRIAQGDFARTTSVPRMLESEPELHEILSPVTEFTHTDSVVRDNTRVTISSKLDLSTIDISKTTPDSTTGVYVGYYYPYSGTLSCYSTRWSVSNSGSTIRLRYIKGACLDPTQKYQYQTKYIQIPTLDLLYGVGKADSERKAIVELKAKQEAEARAAAELKAKQEADARVAAELKAKQEADAKAAAELKAKQEADAKVAAELEAKADAEAKIAAELKAKQEADAKAAATKKSTITCVKGKLTKKVTAVKPKCPTGYKKK